MLTLTLSLSAQTSLYLPYLVRYLSALSVLLPSSWFALRGLSIGNTSAPHKSRLYRLAKLLSIRTLICGVFVFLCLSFALPSPLPDSYYYCPFFDLVHLLMPFIRCPQPSVLFGQQGVTASKLASAFNLLDSGVDMVRAPFTIHERS